MRLTHSLNLHVALLDGCLGWLDGYSKGESNPLGNGPGGDAVEGVPEGLHAVRQSGQETALLHSPLPRREHSLVLIFRKV
ncbi:hypothetical protein BKA70DRAFT_1325285 [Coprinopsis sp. MPI-PUGE-AT-0042]|nr:hypothetical protein BKA70DRAFT_1325285 [Coprinopsis sp. MPI-PUGE-AT-0042]